MRICRISIAAACVSLIVSAAFATDIPRLITYQGKLTDDTGIPVADGDYELVFAIFVDSTVLTDLWEETQTVTITGGLFDVHLGKITPLDPVIFNEHPDLFLGMWFSDTRDEFLPRVRLVSNPFSYLALRADTAEFAYATVVVGSGWIDDGSVVRLETGTDSVGIGTSTPSEKLEVAGNLRVSGKAAIGSSCASSGSYAFTAGSNNTALGNWSTVTGGFLNNAEAMYTTVSGGANNKAMANYATVGGGQVNFARGIYSVVAGGGGPAMEDSNSAHGEYSAVSGGRRNIAVGDRSSIGGGYGSIAEGSHARIGGGRLHLTQGDYATIGGGIKDTATGDYTTIAGGAHNYTGGDYCTVGGGGENSAWGSGYATVGGGYRNEAYGQYSMIPGGYGCVATASYSFAAGRQAWVEGTGSFVWADNNPFQYGQGAYTNRFLVRATGGVAFVSGIDGTGATTSGVILGSGSGAWSPLCDRNLKENFTPVDQKEILEKVAALPVTSWNYIAQGDSIRHIGPMAQDIYATFGLGEDDRHITTIDADGIALAAIQGLYKQNAEQKQKIDELRAENETIKAQFTELQAMLQQLIAQQR